MNTALDEALADRLVQRLDDLAVRLDRLEQSAARRQAWTEALISIHAVLGGGGEGGGAGSGLRAPLPAFEGDRIAPDCGKILLNAAFEVQPRVVVEFGSGLSTLLLGYALQKMAHQAGPGEEPGEVISFDHSAEYADATRANVRRHGLESVVEVIEAPLREIRADDLSGLRSGLPQAMRSEPHRFYDPAVVSRELERRLGEVGAGLGGGGGGPHGRNLACPIDLVFVDGPAGGVREPMSRWPALPLIRGRLSRRAMVILDDANRPGERAVWESWASDTPELDFDSVVRTHKGTGVARVRNGSGERGRP